TTNNKIFAPFFADATAASLVAGFPTHSITRSNVSSILEIFEYRVLAPNLFNKRCFFVFSSQTATFSGDFKQIICKNKDPINPPPIIKTFVAGVMESIKSSPWSTQLKGSTIAPTSKGMSSAKGKQLVAGTTQYSAIPPSRVTPIA